MNNPELHLTLAHAKPGMILARALLDARGQVLMAQGAELSDATIAALHRRDVTALWVLDAGQPSADPTAHQAELLEHYRDRLARLFRHVGDNPDERYLLEIMTRHRGIEAS